MVCSLEFKALCVVSEPGALRCSLDSRLMV